MFLRRPRGKFESVSFLALIDIGEMALSCIEQRSAACPDMAASVRP